MPAVRFALILLILVCATNLRPQEKPAVTREHKLLPLPAIFRFPETRFGFILGGVYVFGDQGERPSQIIAGVGYTQNRQFLSYINSQLVTSGRKYLVSTETGYYDYVYPYSGIGFEAPSGYLEHYYARFPRVRATVLRRLHKNIYAGPKLSFDNYTIWKTDAGGLLSQGITTGDRGGLLFQYGFGVNFDSRDNIFSTYTGWLIETAVTGASKNIAGDYNFTRYYLNVNHFIPLKDNLTLAWNASTELYYGNPPFNAMAYLGGAKVLRGFYDGRYRNKKSVSSQVEIRYRILNWLTLAGFTTTGTVAADIPAFRADQLLFTYGGGFRLTLNQQSRMSIRADYGQTNKGYGNFYVTVAEAF